MNKADIALILEAIREPHPLSDGATPTPSV